MATFDMLSPLCLQLVAHHLDAATRSSFRAACRCTHLAANLSTTRLGIQRHAAMQNLSSSQLVSFVLQDAQAPSIAQPTFIPKALLHKLPNLVKIQVRDMETLASWPEALPPTLQCLDLSGSGLSKSPTPTFSALSTCASAMRELQLGWLALGPAGATALAPVLQQMRGLELLGLENNSLQGEGMLALAPAISTLTNLHELKLSSNLLVGEKVAAVVAATVAPLTCLRRLYVGGGTNNLCSVALLQALRHHPKLETTDLWSHAYLHKFAEHVATTLQHTAKLRLLTLCSAELLEDDMDDLAPATQGLPCLEAVNLTPGGEQEELEDTWPLRVLVHPLQHLLYVSLSGSLLDPLCVLELARSLTGLTKLQGLELNDCGLRCRGVVTLAPSLRLLKHLRSLDLSLNQIGDRGGKVLCASLCFMPKLHDLSLMHNSFSKDMAWALVYQARKLPCLEWVHVDGDAHDMDM